MPAGTGMGIGDIFNKNYSPVFWCQFRIRVTKKKRNAAAQQTNFDIKIVNHYVLRLRWATVESLLSRRVKRQSQ